MSHCDLGRRNERPLDSASVEAHACEPAEPSIANPCPERPRALAETPPVLGSVTATGRLATVSLPVAWKAPGAGPRLPSGLSHCDECGTRTAPSVRLYFEKTHQLKHPRLKQQRGHPAIYSTTGVLPGQPSVRSALNAATTILVRRAAPPIPLSSGSAAVGTRGCQVSEPLSLVRKARS